jgi:hypothetical protein
MQTEINFNGRELRDAGIALAVEHAEQVIPDWKEKAFSMFVEWLSGWPCGYKFLMEDARQSLEVRGLPAPPSLRAYGHLIVRAKKEGLIIHSGYRQVKNVRAHCANASVWMVASN